MAIARVMARIRRTVLPVERAGGGSCEPGSSRTWNGEAVRADGNIESVDGVVGIEPTMSVSVRPALAKRQPRAAHAVEGRAAGAAVRSGRGRR